MERAPFLGYTRQHFRGARTPWFTPSMGRTYDNANTDDASHFAFTGHEVDGKARTMIPGSFSCVATNLTEYFVVPFTPCSESGKIVSEVRR